MLKRFCDQCGKEVDAREVSNISESFRIDGGVFPSIWYKGELVICRKAIEVKGQCKDLDLCEFCMNAAMFEASKRLLKSMKKKMRKYLNAEGE